MPNPNRKKPATHGTRCVWVAGVAEMYGISRITVWRWERDGKLPPKDVFVGGVAVGWKPETLERAMSGAEGREAIRA